jgi:nucleoside-diphosphate-sugar epimerase
VIFGDGEQSRDFTYIDNTVDGTVLASTADGVAGETFNVACGEATTLNQLLEHIREISGKAVEASYQERQPGDLQRSQADISRARESIGYDPAIDVRAGLERTFVHLADQAATVGHD